MNAEKQRLIEARESNIPWRKWGPYLSERQWGTVREDYSDDGNAWAYFPHDQARSRAYRWGEDGLALALFLLLSLGFFLWAELVFPLWVLVISVHILLANLRRSKGENSLL